MISTRLGCFAKLSLHQFSPSSVAVYPIFYNFGLNLLLSFYPHPPSPDFMEVMKCEHERAVHLFVDSLMNRDHMSFAFQCTDPTRFRKGICLSCRKNRCNNIGYNTRKMRKRRNSKMYLKTRADTPFGGEPLAVVTYNFLLILSPTIVMFTDKSRMRSPLRYSPYLETYQWICLLVKYYLHLLCVCVCI